VRVIGARRSSLYAWRRANVATLNERAREWMNTTGWLSGPKYLAGGQSQGGSLTYRSVEEVRLATSPPKKGESSST
jgi:hypothetical protein